MLSLELQSTLRLVVTLAKQRSHEYLTVEHLLLALLDNENAIEALVACAVNVEQLDKDLTQYIEEHTPSVDVNEDYSPQPTRSFDRILQRRRSQHGTMQLVLWQSFQSRHDIQVSDLGSLVQRFSFSQHRRHAA